MTKAGKPWYPMVKEILKYVHCRLKFYTDIDEEDNFPTVRAYVHEDRDCDISDVDYGAAGEVPVYGGLYEERDRFEGFRWEWWVDPFSVADQA